MPVFLPYIPFGVDWRFQLPADTSHNRLQRNSVSLSCVYRSLAQHWWQDLHLVPQLSSSGAGWYPSRQRPCGGWRAGCWIPRKREPHVILRHRYLRWHLYKNESLHEQKATRINRITWLILYHKMFKQIKHFQLMGSETIDFSKIYIASLEKSY